MTMKRSNFVIGLGLSVVLHAALLYMLLGGSRPPAPTPARPRVTPIQIASIDPRDKLPIEQIETDLLPMITTPRTTGAALETPAPPPPSKPVPALLPLERVVEPARGAPQRLAALPEPTETPAARPASRRRSTRTIQTRREWDSVR